MHRLCTSHVLFVLACFAQISAARAEDRVTVRGVYFREPSTRIVEPMVMVTKDLPKEFDVGAYYLLDAVTSASAAQGTAQDAILTEQRHEAGLKAGVTRNHSRFGGGFRYSSEPDYKSQTVTLDFQHSVWGNTGMLAVNLAKGQDHILSKNFVDRKLDTYFAGVGYTQALSPTWIVQAGYEAQWLDGYQANPYIYTNGNRPRVPEQRLRHVFAARAATYVPALELGFQLHYRLYFDQGPTFTPDPWHMVANTAEARIYKTLFRDLEIRLSYRLHRQTGADFWCNTDQNRGGSPGCYGSDAIFQSADAKYGPLTTHFPELKISWDLRIFAHVPVLSFFAPGTGDVSYGYFMQNDHYGNAHVLQTGYTLPF